MPMRLFGVLFGALLLGFGLSPARAETRIALVIGNSAYRNVTPLENPGSDAKLIADTLIGLGFNLVGGRAQLDLDKPSIDRVVQAFGRQLAGADVGLFYYAGHGVQIRGENFLVPIDANPTREADVDFQMFDTNVLLRQMQGAGTRLNIVILDACRNNPFFGRGLAVGRAQDAGNIRLRDLASGLAQMQAPEGTLISFATQPGSVAQDGFGRHSPFARALADTMPRPGVGIFDTFNQVGLDVKRTTGGAQQPWVSSSPIEGTFYFVPPKAVVAAPPVPAAPPADEIAWDYLKSTTDIAALRRFLDQFPNSARRPEAEKRMAALTPPPEKPAPAEPVPDRREMTRSLQQELKRVGCFDGQVDGDFGGTTRAALRNFVKLAGLSVPEDVTPDMLKALRGFDKRVCPLACAAEERAEGDHCVRIRCPTGRVLKDGNCVAQAVEAPKRPPPDNPAPARPAPSAAPAAGAKGNGKCFAFQGKQFCE
jgi:uncharacterized caspase-like protein